MAAPERLSGVPVLRAERIAVTSPGSSTAVVDGFDLELGAGEWVALTGPNGSGKTSLVLALAGLRPIRGGAVDLLGERTAPSDRDRLRSTVSIVMQEPEAQLLQPTVREELAFGALNRGVPAGLTTSRVRSLSARLGLDDVLESDPHALSAGRQQLVLIAAALAEDTRILILDEPGAHLDPSARSLVMALVRERVRAGLSVLWVTQEVDELEAADRVVRMAGGLLARSAPEVASGIARGSGGGGDLEPAEGAVPLLTIDVRAWDGRPGPRVATSKPLTLTIPPRGIVAVEGRNGAGKSVLLGTVAGWLDLDQIEVRWSAEPSCAPALAVQYPELQIFEELAASEVVHTAVSRGMSRADAIKEAERLLARLGLEPARLLGRRSWDLSAGEKRILQLVGAMIAPSPLLILDEPTSGLDPERRLGLAATLVERSEGGAVLVASQDGIWLDRMSPRRLSLGVMDEGQTATYGQKTD
jgi:energy-coupling factor transport system ATP-binding protein